LPRPAAMARVSALLMLVLAVLMAAMMPAQARAAL
jgi:hypothetical protein